MKNSILSIIILAIFISMCIPAEAASEDQTVEVSAESSLSKEDALRQAMRNAVEQSVGVFILSETEVENFELKKDKIFSKSEGYVTRYTLIKEEKTGGIFKVVISATVSLDKIKDDLIAMKILLESLARPKIMVLIEESFTSTEKARISIDGKDEGQMDVSIKAFEGYDNNMLITETEISSLLLEKGFELVDKTQLETAANFEKRRQALAGNIVAANSLALNFGAQYVILGKAVAQDNGEAYPGTGLHSIQASLQTKVLQTQTGLILGSIVKNDAAAHISPMTGATIAFQKAAKKVVDQYLVDAITDSFQDFLNNGAPLKLNVSGVTSFQLYKQIASNVDSLDRVVSSKREAWNKTGGLLILDMRFKGTSEELAELLDGMAVGNNSLEVVDLAPERVDCNLK